MAIGKNAPELRPLVDDVAGFIGDPVRRLRFLQAVVSPDRVLGERPRRRPRASRILICALAVAVALTAALLLTRSNARAGLARPAVELAPARLPKPRAAGSEVWRVEDSGGSETYSNGLRIDNTLAVSNHRRAYAAFPISGDPPVPRSDPAGIVFHSTESTQAPFEPGHNETLKKIGESLLDYIRRQRAYNFLIDRFGRVYRVVAETDAANHAGHSVWTDGRWLYLGLNESFLGIAFEAQTGGSPAESRNTAAQTRSAVMLVEMLRARYRIPAVNCVTHAQVSVNPSNMLVGYHVDWGADFPYEELGLPDNYAAALPSIWACGFEWDEAFWNAIGGRLRRGVNAAERTLAARAAQAGLGTAAYRKRLRQEYRRRLAEAGWSGRR